MVSIKRAKFFDSTAEYVLRCPFEPVETELLLRRLTYYSPNPVTLRVGYSSTNAFAAGVIMSDPGTTERIVTHKQVPRHARKVQKQKVTTNRQEISDTVVYSSWSKNDITNCHVFSPDI
ncbi:hypothetical protein PISMIDRAFT_435899 [Pisolithus microcarpus 441]|uniref:Uncharacterized protein n=1 Tax=Pisolithus microcarpus 441 TaxID=765257 RepID=A0A0C9ZVL8_9AGAM|nr:hypothetical protein PISMIDRAFT_435899 [Pisolithus microcarpus 441]